MFKKESEEIMSKVSCDDDYYRSPSKITNLEIEDYEFIGLFGNKYPYAKMQNLWEQNEDLFDNEETFSEFLSRFNSVAILYNNKFIGCLFIDNFNKTHCYINGFAERKKGEHTSKSLKLYCDYLIKQNRYDYILSKTEVKEAIYCLLKAGFNGSDGLYMYTSKKL